MYRRYALATGLTMFATVLAMQIASGDLGIHKTKSIAVSLSVVPVQPSADFDTRAPPPLSTVSGGISRALETKTKPTTILLAGGNHGVVTLTGNDIPHPKDGTVTTIRPETPQTHAVISGLVLDGVSNIVFENIVFDYSAEAGATFRDRPFQIRNSYNIGISNSVFDGDLVDATYGGQALFVRNSDTVSVTGTEFRKFHRAGVFLNSKNLLIRENDFHSIRSDGLDFAQVEDVEIADNNFHDFAPASDGDHRDMIQFWTNKTTKPTQNVYIHHNRMFGAKGAPTQSIFMRNEVVDSQGGGPEMFYRNIRIEHNLIYNGDTHGITTAETDGLIISNNTVLQYAYAPDDRLVHVPKIHIKPDSKNVVVTYNISGNAIDGSAHWTIHGNAIAQRNAEAPEHRYNALFINAMAPEPEVADLQAIPGGTLDTLRAGADYTRFKHTPAQLTALIQRKQKPDHVVFNAGFSRNRYSKLPLGAEYDWDFGDGEAASGRDVRHAYAAPGQYEVTLTATLPSGDKDTNQTIVTVADPQLLNLAFVDGRMVDTSAYQHALPAHSITLDSEKNALRITPTARMEFGRRQPVPVTMSESIWVEVEFMAASDVGGHLARVHGAWLLNVGADGELLFFANTSAGQKFKLKTQGADLLSPGWKTVAVSYDRTKERMQAYVDGTLVGSIKATGAIKRASSHGLTIGQAYNWNGFDGYLRRLSIRNAPPDVVKN